MKLLLQSVFDNLVDLTEPICQHIDSRLASMTIFDTSGIEAWVTENNPKYANRIIKQLKAFAKANNFDKNYDPYKAAYGSMPAHAAANQAIQQMYINGHFCYAYKFGIITNGPGIVRDITFYNKALLSVLIDFFQKHPLINPKTFLGDAAFDTIEIYKTLFGNLSFEKAFIPLRVKLSWEYNRETKTKCRVCHCDHPCTTSSCGRMIYAYPEKNLPAFPNWLRS